MPGKGDTFNEFLKQTGSLAPGSTLPVDPVLFQFMTYQNVDYTDDNLQDRDTPSEKCKGIWTFIATALVNKYASDRAAKVHPKNKPGKYTFSPVGLPPLGAGTGAEGVLLPKNLEEWKKNTITSIEKWFERNWLDAVQTGTGETTPFNTVPKNADQSITVQDQFNKFYVGGKFGVGGGVPIPAALKTDPNSTQEYVNYVAPHRDAQGNGFYTIGTKKYREGAFGYCMGPFNRNVKIVPVDKKTTTIKDGNKTYDDVQVYKEVPPGDDENEFVLDLPEYESVLREFKNYTSYRKENPDYTGQVFDGKEIKIPEFGDPIEFDEEGDPIPIREISLDPPVYNPGKNGDQLVFDGSTSDGISNPNFGNPLDSDNYGAALMETFPLDDANQTAWKYSPGDPVLGSVDRTFKRVWGHSGPAIGKMTKSSKADFRTEGGEAKVDAPSDETGNVYSYSDPRTWGPWDEYNDTSETDSDQPDSKIGFAWKYIVPNKTAFEAMKSAANSGVPIEGKPGVPKPGEGNSAYPSMNKAYFGLRLREVFPRASSAAEAREALNAPALPGTPDSKAVVEPGTASVRAGAKLIAGPAPPLNIKVTSKASDFGFKFSNDKVLFLSGKVGRGDGKTFKRTEATPNSEPPNVFIKHMLTVEDNDSKPKIQGSGGMLWLDPAKQIISPYAPPPLKPFLPNNEKITTTGVS